MRRISGYPKIGVFIIDNDPGRVIGLKNYLQIRFGKLMHISTFNTGNAALADITNATDIIILENYLTGENGTDIRNSIKEKNNSIQVIRLGTKREVGDALEIYNNGVSRSPYSGSPGNKFLAPVYRMIGYPARVISKEFRINMFLAILLASFLFIGILTAIIITFIV